MLALLAALISCLFTSFFVVAAPTNNTSHYLFRRADPIQVHMRATCCYYLVLTARLSNSQLLLPRLHGPRVIIQVLDFKSTIKAIW